jgi:hypothetical protein
MIVVFRSTGETEKKKKYAGKERRRHPRYDCDGQAETLVIYSGCLFRGTVRDISETGCYIETKAWLNLKRFAEVDLRLMVNENDYRTFARVMYIRFGKGVGFEFLFPNPATEKLFKDLIETLARTAFPQKTEKPSRPVEKV